MASAPATARSEGSRAPLAKAPRSIALAMARARLRNSGPEPSDQGPSELTNSVTAPLRPEVALFGMSQFRERSSGMADTSSPFGTRFAREMTVARWADGVWDTPKLTPVEPIPLHPGAHALHYGSACFEGLKAHRGADGVVRIF